MQNVREMEIMAEVVAKEKGISKESVLSFLEDGMQVAMKKYFPEGALIQIEIDTHHQTINGWRLFKLVDAIENVEAEMLHSEVDNEEVLDGYVWETIKVELTRQQLNIVKQVALQKMRNESRSVQIDNLLSKPNKVFTGTVKVHRKDSMIVDIMGLDIVIPRRNIIPGESYKAGAKITFTLEKNDRGVYVGTRTSNDFIVELFKKEIIQIEEGQIEIVKVARVPGFKTKILVKSKSYKIDPIKICVGHKGSHIKNVQMYLNGEYIDVLEYDSDPAQLLLKALNPIQVSKIIVDEEKNKIEVAVSDEEIGYAIGRGGKNIDLTTQLLGWDVKIFSESQWEKRHTIERNANIKIFMTILDCDEELAEYLVDAGFTDVEEIAYVPEEELAQDLTDLDAETIAALKDNAKEALKDQLKIKNAKHLHGLYMLGLSDDEINHLLDSQVTSVEGVADLSTDEMVEIIPDIDIENAKSIIMKARKFAFAD